MQSPMPRLCVLVKGKLHPDGSKGMEGEGEQPEQRPSSTQELFRRHPWDGDGRSSRNGAGLGPWEAQVGVSCCQPPCISPETSQKGGLVYLI